MKKKVLHVINSLTPGGAEILLINSLSVGGLQENTDNTVVYFQGISPIAERIDKRVKVICLDYKGIAGLAAILIKLRKIINELRPNIIHTHLNPAGFYVNLIRPRAIPQVHTMHIAYSTDLETSAVMRWLERNLLLKKKYCHLIFLSRFTKKDFLENVKFKGHPHVLNNFVDNTYFNQPTKKYSNVPGDALKLIAVGNFREQKNYFYLLNIFKELKEYNIHLDIYGGGNLERYQQVINNNQLKVTLKGPTNNIHELIMNYDLFIMSSTNEGFPLSVFEAMASGVPLMLSNITPLTSIVKDNAVYFELNDAGKAANQIISISQNRTGINAMAVKAKLYAEQTVTMEIYIKNLLEIYAQMLR